jgi:hypothetical protein
MVEKGKGRGYKAGEEKSRDNGGKAGCEGGKEEDERRKATFATVLTDSGVSQVYVCDICKGHKGAAG